MDVEKKIDKYISSLPEWKRKNLEMFRRLLHSNVPNLGEDWKWDVPVFTNDGKLFSAMSSFTNHTKFNFTNGAVTEDKHSLFNSGLDSKKHRSINMEEGDTINEEHLKELIKATISVIK